MRVKDTAKPGDTVINHVEARADGTSTLQAESRNVVGTATLSVEARVVSQSVAPGRDINLSACVQNHGTATAHNVTLVAGPMPTSLTRFQPGDGGHYDTLANKVTWELGDLVPGGSCTYVDLTAQVSSMAQFGDIIVIPWVATQDVGPDGHLTQSITVGSGCPDIRLSVDLSDTQIQPHQEFHLGTTVEQRQPTPVGTLELLITMPDGMVVRDVPTDCTRGTAVQSPVVSTEPPATTGSRWAYRWKAMTPTTAPSKRH